VARSRVVGMAESGGDLRRRGWGEEGADMWSTHVSDQGVNRQRGWKEKSKGGNTLSRGRQ
jgi:hypothetical protein